MLRAFANLRQEPISLELAKNHLTNLGQEQIILKPETILSVVSEFYGLAVEDVRGRNVSGRWYMPDTWPCTSFETFSPITRIR